MISMIVGPLAEADIAEASVWYERKQAELGLAFLNEIDAALAAAAANPFRFPRFRRRPEVRRILVSRFPYCIFFIRHTDRLIVFRILHQARHEREWTSKIIDE